GLNEITLFRHFGSKDALLLEAVRYQGAAERPALTLPLEPVDPERELLAWCLSRFEFLYERRSLIRTAMGESAERRDMSRCAARTPGHPSDELSGYLARLK